MMHAAKRERERKKRERGSLLGAEKSCGEGGWGGLLISSAAEWTGESLRMDGWRQKREGKQVCYSFCVYFSLFFLCVCERECERE